MRRKRARQARVTELDDGIEVSVRVRGGGQVITYGLMWVVLAAIYIGGIWTRRGTGGPAGEIAFAVVWAVVVALLSLRLMGEVIWLLSGREVLTVQGGRFIVSREMPLWRRVRPFRTDRVRAFRVAPTGPSSAGRFVGSLRPVQQIELPGTAIAFDCDGQTYHFGVGLDEETAKVVVARVLEVYPQLGAGSTT